MKKQLVNNKGFTMVELLVALGLSVLLGLITVGFQLDMQRAVQKLEDRADFVTDSNIGLRVLWDILGMMRPSFNNLSLNDDSGRNFFDMATDMSIPGSNGTIMNRVFSLDYEQIDNGKTEFIFLVEDPKRGASVLYNPVHAYNAGEFFNGVIQYVSLNQNNIVTNKLQNAPPLQKRIMAPLELVMLQSPVQLKDISLLSDSDFVTNQYLYALSRQFSFLGRVNTNGTDLTKESYEVNFNYRHPAFLSLEMNNPDDFFRYLPPSLGGGAYSLLSPVAMMKLRVEKAKTVASLKKINVYLSRRTSAGYGNEFLIFSEISKLSLIRQDISAPMVKIEVVD